MHAARKSIRKHQDWKGKKCTNFCKIRQFCNALRPLLHTLALSSADRPVATLSWTNRFMLLVLRSKWISQFSQGNICFGFTSVSEPVGVCSYTSIHYWRIFQNVSGFLRKPRKQLYVMLHFCRDMIKVNEGGCEEFLKKLSLGRYNVF